jgi:hypothetical protein
MNLRYGFGLFGWVLVPLWLGFGVLIVKEMIYKSKIGEGEIFLKVLVGIVRLFVNILGTNIVLKLDGWVEMKWVEVIWPIWIVASLGLAGCIIPLFWLVIDAVKYGFEVIGNPNWPENAGDKEKAGFLKLRMKVSLWGCWFFPGLTIFGGIFVSKSTELLDLLHPNVAETWTAGQSET